MGIHVNPDHEGEESSEYPVCPGCGKRHEPDLTNLIPINVLELVKQSATMLSIVPKEDQQRMIASFVGVFAENISDEVWEEVLLTPVKPCGHPECNCHEIIRDCLRHMHKMKLAADKIKKEECAI